MKMSWHWYFLVYYLRLILMMRFLETESKTYVGAIYSYMASSIQSTCLIVLSMIFCNNDPFQQDWIYFQNIARCLIVWCNDILFYYQAYNHGRYKARSELEKIFIVSSFSFFPIVKSTDFVRKRENKIKYYHF